MKELLKYSGLDFIKKLLQYEQTRFDENFMSGSAFEKMNAEFGIFPAKKVYPVYFAGDLTEREKNKKKLIFVGFNPGYSEEHHEEEQATLEAKGYFEMSCEYFKYFKKQNKPLSYYSNIYSFIERLFQAKKLKINEQWDWFQKNLINLEFIPYHSKDAAGLRINNLQEFKYTHFESFCKFLSYLDPEDPIFINGFPTFEKYFADPIFKQDITFIKTKSGNVWVGTIRGYRFIGLPFLTRVAGGLDGVVTNVQGILKETDFSHRAELT